MIPLSSRLSPGAWKGRPVYVVGSGPSRAGLNLGQILQGEFSIGCNEEFRWAPTIALCQDVRFFFGDGSPGRIPAKDNPEWYAGKSIPVFFRGHPDRPDPPYDDLGKIYEVPAATVPSGKHGGVEFVWGRALDGPSGGLYYGANCGLAALNLADILGADPIYLIGFDCASRGGTDCAHGFYPPDWGRGNADAQNQVFRIWARDFRKAAPWIRARVYNVCPWSGIDAFPKVGAFPAGGRIWEIRDPEAEPEAGPVRAPEARG